MIKLYSVFSKYEHICECEHTHTQGNIYAVWKHSLCFQVAKG